MQSSPRYLSPADAAEMFDVTPEQILELIESGEIEAVRIGGAWRIATVAMDAWVQDQYESERQRGLWRAAQNANVIDFFGNRD